MRGNLGVRISDGTIDRHVTRHVRGLTFRKTAPGGHHSAGCQVLLPRDTFPDLGPADRMWIYDTRTGATVWEGYTDNPGNTGGAEGESFALSAMGGQVLAQDRSIWSVLFIDRAVGAGTWIRSHGGWTTGGVDMVTPAGELQLQFPNGIPVSASPLSWVMMQYLGAWKADQRLLAVTTDTIAGKSDAGYETHIVTGDDGVRIEVPSTRAFSTTIGTQAVTAGADFPSDRNSLWLRIARAGGATNVADDLTWAQFGNIAVRPVLVDRRGADVVSGYTTTGVYAHEVVEHLLGEHLPMFDGPNSLIDTTAHLIDQLAYYDGATARQILDDLSMWEPDMLWEVLETGDDGKHGFNYRAWPTAPRYEISTRDGFSAPGGEMDLCNRVVIHWTDGAGNRTATVVYSTVPELGGRVRDAPAVTLPEGMGSPSNALAIGTQVLAGKAAPPKSAKATVARPILDRLTGSVVMPWEMKPGYLVRVRETGDDLRLTEVAYVDDRVSADLTLGTPQRSVEQMVATLAAPR